MMWNLRLLPLLAVAAFCLLALKSAALLLGGGGGLTGSVVATAQTPAPQPAAEKQDPRPAPEAVPPQTTAAADQTAKPKPAKKGKGAKKEVEPEEVDGVSMPVIPEGIPRTESELLQSLAERRRALEKQERDLGMRENLLKAAEQKVEERINELKAIESRIETELKKSDDEQDEQYARLVKMYSGMKPRLAAEVFNRLDLDVLLGIVTRMKPQAMAPIMAAMDPVVAQRVTMEIANRGQATRPETPALPKITGQGSS